MHECSQPKPVYSLGQFECGNVRTMSIRVSTTKFACEYKILQIHTATEHAPHLVAHVCFRGGYSANMVEE
jgi:hypothetical protein